MRAARGSLGAAMGGESRPRSWAEISPSGRSMRARDLASRLPSSREVQMVEARKRVDSLRIISFSNCFLPGFIRLHVWQKSFTFQCICQQNCPGPLLWAAKVETSRDEWLRPQPERWIECGRLPINNPNDGPISVLTVSSRPHSPSDMGISTASSSG